MSDMVQGARPEILRDAGHTPEMETAGGPTLALRDWLDTPPIPRGARIETGRRPMPKTLKDMIAEADGVVPRIDAAEARRLMDAGALVVDVRDPAEVAASGKVPGAVNVPRGMLEFKADTTAPSHDPAFDAGRPVVLYCAAGGRAALAGKTLHDMGFAQVHNLGGFKDWIAGGGTAEQA